MKIAEKIFARGTSENTNAVVEQKPFKEIHIRTTTLFTHPSWEAPCSSCGKQDYILAGMPSSIWVSVPLTDEEHEYIVEHPFWMAGEFEVNCNNGFSHTVVGMKPKGKGWIITSEEDVFTSPVKAEGVWFEYVLSQFIPLYIEYIKSGGKFRSVQGNLSSDSKSNPKLSDSFRPVFSSNAEK